MSGTLWRSAMVAALFCLHPLHVESVAWIAERKDVLSTFFFLVTLLVYLRYCANPRRQTYCIALAVFACGLMAKQMLVTLPCVLLLLDFWPLRRLDGRDQWHTRAGILLAEKIPFFMLSAIAGALALWAQKTWGAVIPLESISVWQRCLNALAAYTFYLWKTICPTNLAVYYLHPTHYHWPTIVGALCLLTTISLIAVRRRHQWPWFAFGWLWYLGTLVPVIGLVQVGNQAYADRYTYIPLIGIFIIVAWLADALGKRLHHGAAWIGLVAVCWLVMLGVLSRYQASYWRDTETLFGHTARVTHDNHIAHSIYGVALLGRGRYDEAVEQFLTANRIKPDAVRVHINCGIAYEAMGRLDDAIGQYRRAIDLQPTAWKAYNNLGLVLVKKSEVGAAIDAYQRAAQLNPKAWEVYANLGEALRIQDKPQSAIKAFSAAIALNPGRISPYFNRGSLYATQGEYDRALRDFQQILHMDPRHRPALFQTGVAFFQKGDVDRAAAYLSRLLGRVITAEQTPSLIDSLRTR
jgi:tetratricopeptide (TPR) repeat protein